MTPLDGLSLPPDDIVLGMDEDGLYDLLDQGHGAAFPGNDEDFLRAFGLIQPGPSTATSLQLLGGAHVRCLDASHLQPCSQCTPPPADVELDDFELRSDTVGKRNGERRLRSLLSRTPEWCSLEERTRVAELCEGQPAFARLAASLRARQSAELRKGDLLKLCRMWNYRSHIWRRKKDGALARPTAAAPPPPPPAPPQASQPVAASLHAVHELVGGWMGARAKSSVECFGNTQHTQYYHAILRRGIWPMAVPFALAAATRKKGNASLVSGELRTVSEALGRLVALLRGIQGQLSGDGAGAPAWLAVSANQEVEELCNQGEACIRRVRTVCGMAMRPADPVPADLLAALTADAAQAADVRDLGHISNGDPHCAMGGRNAVELCTHLSSTLTQLRRDATFTDFLEGSCLLLTMLQVQADGLAAGVEAHLAILDDAVATVSAVV